MSLTLQQLFTEARSHNRFTDEPVPDETLRALYDLLKWGPTAANGTPARIVFVKSPEAKARLLPCMSSGNQEKTRSAPVIAVIGADHAFHEHLPRLSPQNNAKSWFDGKPDLIATTALRNSSLQGGYLILAARALGLDAGPMSGFDAAKVDAAFWQGTAVQTNFVVALGHGKPEALYPRADRLTFDEACRIA